MSRRGRWSCKTLSLSTWDWNIFSLVGRYLTCRTPLHGCHLLHMLASSAVTSSKDTICYFQDSNEYNMLFTIVVIR